MKLSFFNWKLLCYYLLLSVYVFLGSNIQILIRCQMQLFGILLFQLKNNITAYSRIEFEDWGFNSVFCLSFWSMESIQAVWQVHYIACYIVLTLLGHTGTAGRERLPVEDHKVNFKQYYFIWARVKVNRMNKKSFLCNSVICINNGTKGGKKKTNPLCY